MSVLLASLLFILSAIAPTTIGEGPDNHGREFIVAFLENQIHSSGPNDLEIFMTTVSNTDSNVTLTTPFYNNNFQEDVVVSRGSIYKVLIDYNIRGSGTELAYKSVYIISTEEIVVYCVNKETFSTDAFVAVPTDTLGREYYVMTYYKGPMFLVAATVDSTDLTITFPTPLYSSIDLTYNGVSYTDGDTLTVTLNRFQVFFGQQSGTSTDDDFTGTYIVSTEPVFVVSGNVKSAVPNTSGSSDHLTEMLFPIECWGKSFLSYSTPDRGRGDIMRIMAAEDNTAVNMTSSSGLDTFTLNAGQFQEYDKDTGDIVSINSDKGVTVGIFSKTFDNDGPNYGDPAFSFLIPIPLFAPDYTYSTIQLPSGDDFNNKLTLIIDERYTDGLRLDENNISVTWNSIPGSNGYVEGWLYVSPGSHNIFHTDPTKVFMAMATGTENFNSYAFSSGQRMTQINMPCSPVATVAGDILDNDCDGFIDEEADNGIDDDLDGLIDEDLALPPRVNGEWSSWGNWSECSVTCMGSGQQTRTRQCDNPAPQNNGIYCVGGDTEYQSCDNTHITTCGVWSVWSDWSPCSVTCNEGFQTRDRNCTDVVTGQPDSCIGEYNETQACDVGPLQGVCHNNVSGNCSYCDWGYTGSSCDQCVTNYTGCYCEYCKVDLIGYSTNCSTTCYHGYASITGGDQCDCHENNTLGYWQNEVCSTCLDGFDSPDCINCAPAWVGTDHCSIPCTNGAFAYDYDGTTGNDEIVAHFSCLQESGASYLAWMGYSSFNSKVVAIPVGVNNLVEGGVANSQEAEFRPGYHQYVFTIGPFTTGDVITWTLGNPANGTSTNVTLPTAATPMCPVNETLSKPVLLDVGTSADIGYCQCTTGYYGASCTYECPGGSSNPCSGHGPCRVTTGVCICQSRWTTTLYDYDLYDEGYVSTNNSYDCSACSQDWYGDDCSTARTTRVINGTGHYGAIASSGIITLDGATLELAKPGVYRLFESNVTKVDGFFVPCRGRHDCHTLKEVALTYNNMTFSMAVDASDATSLNVSVDSTSDFPYTYTGDNIDVTYSVNDVVRIKIDNDVDLVMTNINGELMAGFTVPANSAVTGLLGNADGDWVNDVSDRASTGSYTSADLVASAKATNAETNFRLTPSQSHLVQNDPSTSMGSGGYALGLNVSSSANVSGFSLPSTNQMAFDLWVNIPTTASTVANVASIDTSLGPMHLVVTNGQLSLEWGGQVMTSGITVGNDWTHLAVSWEGVDGNLTLQAATNISSPVQSETITGVNNGSTITTLTSVAFGGGATDTPMYLDYFRLFDQERSQSQILGDFTIYTDTMATNQRLLVPFDEGTNSTTFSTKVYAYDMYSNAVGTLDGASGTYSTVAFSDVLVVQDLAAILAETEAVTACYAELNKTVFNSYCNGFDAVKQMILENCISDYIRTNDTVIVSLAGSVFAHYCQGVTQVAECEFAGFLDFCTSSAGGGGGMSPILFAGAGIGVLAIAALAACCCCCLKGIIGRKKVRDDDDEEEEEEEEKEPMPQEQPPQTPLPGTGSLKPMEASMAPAYTASAKAAMVSAAFLKMRQPSNMSLPQEKPFEPLHNGRWTGYGWLPGARPVEGVSSDPPEEPGSCSPIPVSPAPEDGPQMSASGPTTGTAPLNRVTTDSSITVSIDSSYNDNPLTPVQAPLD